MNSVPRLRRKIEQLVDELILPADIVAADPPRLPLPDHVDRLVSRNRSPRRSKFAKVLLGLHPAFDRPVVLLQDVVQVSAVRLSLLGGLISDVWSIA